MNQHSDSHSPLSRSHHDQSSPNQSDQWRRNLQSQDDQEGAKIQKLGQGAERPEVFDPGVRPGVGFGPGLPRHRIHQELGTQACGSTHAEKKLQRVVTRSLAEEKAVIHSEIINVYIVMQSDNK